MLALRAATGFAACAIAIAIGITMTVFACRRLKAAKASPAAEGAAEGADGAQRSAEALLAPEAVLFAQREEPAPQKEEERRDE